MLWVPTLTLAGRPAVGRRGGECHHNKRHLPAPSLPLPPLSLPSGHAPEQKLQSGHLIGGVRVPGEGLQVTAAVPLVKEVLGRRRGAGRPVSVRPAGKQPTPTPPVSTPDIQVQSQQGHQILQEPPAQATLTPTSLSQGA